MCLRQCRKNHIDFTPWRAYRYAHRGLHNLASGIPENSLPAFQAAAAGGFGAELDVHLTRDGRLVVVHDSSLARLCGLDRAVCTMDSGELRALPLLGTELQIPFLEEVLPLFAGKAPLIIEIKTEQGNAAPLTEAVCKMLEGYTGLYCLESFDPRVLVWLRRHRPALCRGQLSCDFSKDKAAGGLMAVSRWIMTRLLSNFLTRPDFIAYRYEDRAQPAVALCRRRYGVPEVSWTIRSQQALSEVEQDGCIPIFEGFVPTP